MSNGAKTSFSIEELRGLPELSDDEVQKVLSEGGSTERVDFNQQQRSNLSQKEIDALPILTDKQVQEALDAGGSVDQISPSTVPDRSSSQRDFTDALERAKQGVGDIVSQFQQGAETTERAFNLAGKDLGERRTKLTAPDTPFEHAAKFAGETFAPLPQFAGAPGFALKGLAAMSKPIANSSKSLILPM